MQEVLNFKSQNILISSFLNFINSEYFDVFLSLAFFNNAFLLIKFEKNNFQELRNYFLKNNICYIENSNEFYKNLDTINIEKFCILNLPSFFTGKKNDEIKFLDFLKIIRSKEKVLVGASFEFFVPTFYLKDLESRFNSCVSVNFEKEVDLNFEKIGIDFLYNNGIKMEPNVLNFILMHVQRDAVSFSILMQVIKNFVETNKVKIKKSHLEQLLLEYAKARN